jgi:hypothetical protein
MESKCEIEHDKEQRSNLKVAKQYLLSIMEIVKIRR